MSARPVILRERAAQDIDEAIDFYFEQGGERAARAFIDAIERALAQIARHSAAGSPRYAHELKLPGLRCAPIPRYPWLAFYFERPDHLDLWRLLHQQRDIPQRMRE